MAYSTASQICTRYTLVLDPAIDHTPVRGPERDLIMRHFEAGATSGSGIARHLSRRTRRFVSNHIRALKEGDHLSPPPYLSLKLRAPPTKQLARANAAAGMAGGPRSSSCESATTWPPAGLDMHVLSGEISRGKKKTRDLTLRSRLSSFCVPNLITPPPPWDPSTDISHLLTGNFVNALRFPGSRAADHAERLRQ
jgi:hypothetical protein